MFHSVFPYLFLIIILCVVTITDLRDHRISDYTIVLAILVKIGHTVFFWGLGRLPLLLIDGLVVSLPVLFLVLLIEKIWEKEAMGGGDIKLIFVTGLYLGWEKNLWMLLIACMIGAVVGVLKARDKDGKEEYFPFGPVIAVATVFCMVI